MLFDTIVLGITTVIVALVPVFMGVKELRHINKETQKKHS